MRLQPKFGLRLLFVAVALAPLLIWGVFQVRERQERAAAKERLAQIARLQPSNEETIERHWSFQPGSEFVSLSLGRDPDPQQLVADCRRAGSRIHRIRLNDDCLVDIALARQIAAAPNLAELLIDTRTQIEPAAFPILLAAAPEIVLPYDQFQAIRALQEPVRPPHHLRLSSLPADPEELIQCLQDAVRWQPKSLYLNAPVRLHRADPDKGFEPGPLRRELNRLQLANPHMLITLRGITDFAGGPAPQYPWKTPELKEMYERRFRNDLEEDVAAKLTEQLLKQAPKAWPLLEEDVRNDYFTWNFDREAESRARELDDLAPWSPTAHFNIGLAHFQRGEYDDAIEAFDRAQRCAWFGFDEWIQEHDFVNLCLRLQAAAHVAAGRRAAGLEMLERQLVGHREDNRFAGIVFTAVWIQCTAPGANSRVAESALQD